MKKNIYQKIYYWGLFLFLIFPTIAKAGNAAMSKLEAFSKNAGYGNANEMTLADTIGKVISTFLSLLGIIFIVLMLLAGYNWMTAQGDDAKVKKATDSIRRAIIGLVITVGSYAIWYFVFKHLISNPN